MSNVFVIITSKPYLSISEQKKEGDGYKLDLLPEKGEKINFAIKEVER